MKFANTHMSRKTSSPYASTISNVNWRFFCKLLPFWAILRSLIRRNIQYRQHIANFFFSNRMFQMFANMTPNDATIARPSTWQYHLLLHLKRTFVTANFNRSYNVDLSISVFSLSCWSKNCNVLEELLILTAWNWLQETVLKVLKPVGQP